MTRWATKTLADVCERITDGSHRTPPFTERGYPFATVVHVDDDGMIDFASCSRISQKEFEELKRNDCRPLRGDVLFSKDGTVGKVAVIDFDADFVVLSSLAILRPKQAVLDQRFLAYALRSESVLRQAINRKSGSAIRRIVLRDLRHVSIPVPPLAEQGRIVKLLDEADELRKLRAQADGRTAALVPALFHKMFGNHASLLRAGSIVNVRDICEVKGGKRLPKGDDYSEEPTPYRYIRVSDIHEGWVDETQLRFLKPETQKEIARYTVKEGDLIITIAGTIGMIAPVRASLDGANLTENAAKLVPRFKGKYDVSFLSEVMQTPFVQNQIGLRTGQVTIGKLALFRIEQLSLPLPPLALQKKFAERVAEIRAMETEQANSRGRLDNLFQSLLHRAFEGEL